MAGSLDIKILLTVMKDIFTHLSGKASEKKKNIIEAHRATNEAYQATYNYLINKNGDYVPMPDLADVWNDASASVMQVDIDLGKMLYSK